MRKAFMYILGLSVISSFLFHPVTAENETAAESVRNTLAEELGIEKEETPGDSFSHEMNSAILLNHLIVSSYEAETSRHSRLYLEELFTDTLDNLNTDKLDEKQKRRSISSKALWSLFECQKRNGKNCMFSIKTHRHTHFVQSSTILPRCSAIGISST